LIFIISESEYFNNMKIYKKVIDRARFKINKKYLLLNNFIYEILQ